MISLWQHFSLNISSPPLPAPPWLILPAYVEVIANKLNKWKMEAFTSIFPRKNISDLFFSWQPILASHSRAPSLCWIIRSRVLRQGFASPLLTSRPWQSLPLLLLFLAKEGAGGLMLFYLFPSAKTSWSSDSIFLAKYQRGELELVSAAFNSHLCTSFSIRSLFKWAKSLTALSSKLLTFLSAFWFWVMVNSLTPFFLKLLISLFNVFTDLFKLLMSFSSPNSDAGSAALPRLANIAKISLYQSVNLIGYRHWNAH